METNRKREILELWFWSVVMAAVEDLFQKPANISTHIMAGKLLLHNFKNFFAKILSNILCQF